MPKLQDIPALPSDAVDLLGAVGYLDASDLAGVDSAELQAELAKANDKLKIIDEHPTTEEIGKWKGAAANYDPGETVEDPHDVEDEPEDDPDRTPAHVNFEDDPEVQEMLLLSPEALPLDPSLIRRHKLKVADIPEGILLSQCHGEVEINLMPPERKTRKQRREAENVPSHVKPLERGEQRGAVSLSEGLNEGLSPDSKKFVRGVLHPNPWRVRISAFFALLVEVMLIANFIGIPWLLYHEYASGDSMLWWVVGLSSGLFLSAICYLFWGIGARCRVCGQRWFAPKKCLKNKKAHHIPVVGYIFPTALHAIFFKWFYCTYCGTAVRLKK